MVGRTREVNRISIHRKNVARDIVPLPHRLQYRGIPGQNRSKLRVTIGARHCIHGWYSEVVDHPTLVPATFVVDYKHWVDVGKDVDEGAGVVRISRKPGFGFQHNANGADRRHTAIRTGDGQLHVVVNTGKDRRKKTFG
jgi:hypothetical protein